MRLTTDELADISSKVEGLQTVEGVEVKEILVSNHKIFLSKQGGAYFVVGISRENENKQGGATR